MEDQADYETKVNTFKVYLETVSQNIAGGVRATDFRDIAPTLSKYCKIATSIEHNITKELHRCIGEAFSEIGVTEKIKELDEMSKGDSSTDIKSQSLSSDPLIIRKHWLNHRKEALKRKLQESRQQTAETSGRIKKRRAVMKQYITYMEKIQNTHFKKILLS